MTKLTALERKVLTALYASAEGNGHDFGFVEDARKCVGTPRQLAGVVASLVKKNLITVAETMNLGYGAFTQFTWNGESDSSENAETVKRLLEG
jgi:hypothetical protein